MVSLRRSTKVASSGVPNFLIEALPLLLKARNFLVHALTLDFPGRTCLVFLGKKLAPHRPRQTHEIVASSKIQPFTGAQGLGTEHRAAANRDQPVRGTKVADKFS